MRPWWNFRKASKPSVVAVAEEKQDRQQERQVQSKKYIVLLRQAAIAAVKNK